MADRQPDENAPEDLLARYVAGDMEAFTCLVRLYEARLYAFLSRYMPDVHMAEDVFQQVFTKVALHAADFDGRASFSTWLFRIARNQAVDELRKRRIQPSRPNSAEPDFDRLSRVQTDTPLDKLARDELGVRIRQALSALPEPQREAFLLKEEADLTFDEIGRVMQCGRETAKSRFRLAVGKLRELLDMD